MFSKTFSIVFLSFLLLGYNDSICQCNVVQKWETQGYEDPSTSLVMYFPLIFELRPDTIVVMNADSKMNHQKVKYIVKSSTCQWDKNEITGYSQYEVIILDNGKSVTIRIDSNSGQGELHISMNLIGAHNPEFKVRKIDP